MLDIRLLRENPEAVERGLRDRGGAELVREALKAERNRTSEAIGQAKRRGENPEAVMARMREVGDRIKDLDAQVKQVDAEVEALLLQLPNLPHPSVPPGTTEDENVEIRRWGEPRQFGFDPKSHDVLGE